MRTQVAAETKSTPTFEVRFVAPDLSPDKVPLRAVSDALSAVQDLASGRDPFEQQHVPQEKAIGLVKVRRGSAVYACLSHAPEEAIENLTRVGRWLSHADENALEADGLVAALQPIKSLSEVAKSVGCRVEVGATAQRRHLLFAVEQDDFARISSKFFVNGETTVVGTVLRVGGATGMRCFLRVAGRRRGLYCDVQSRELARKLGQHLYEQIAATGTAKWIHRTWRIYEFRITDFTRPRLGDAVKAIEEFRRAGLNAWDSVDDPEGYIRELRS
jgi:hypothetical protein